MNSTSFKLSNVNFALILGAGHGIGLALVKELLNQENIRVYATYRNQDKAKDLLELSNKNDNLKIERLDPLDEIKLDEFIEVIQSETQCLDIVINSIGTLHEEYQPERSLKDINVKQLQHYFTVNSIITPIIAQKVQPLLSKETISIFTTISAKVGSIEDNKIGGWYGYRASKAALNMFLKNISIEFNRKRLKSIVLSIHPGTTITDLSKPFIANTKYQLHTPEDTAQNILKVLEDKTLESNGNFYSWDGESITW